MTRRQKFHRATFAIAGLALVMAGCGSDDAAEPAATVDTTAITSAELPVIEVEAVDYAFQNLPESVPAGTRFTLTNDANAELHEFVAIRLADDETRPVEEIVHLPEAELGAIIGAGPPATVLLAAPGGEQIAAVGDGTLTEPGRYLVFCSIPSGVAPEVYLDAAAASNGAPPQVEGGPPHFAHGMFAELVVD